MRPPYPCTSEPRKHDAKVGCALIAAVLGSGGGRDESTGTSSARRAPRGWFRGAAVELRLAADSPVGWRDGVDERMAAQIGFEFGGRQRLGVEVALRLLALLIQEERGLRGRLHALGDHFKAEIVRHRDERTHDRGVAGIVGDLADEAAVDLDP